jgi:hypothetical protein
MRTHFRGLPARASGKGSGISPPMSKTTAEMSLPMKAADEDGEVRMLTDEKSRSGFKDLATLVEARLAHEFNLAGHRMGWLVTSQAFLFAAWNQLVKNDPLPDQKILTYLIPIVGLVTALVGGISLLAAMRITDYLVTDRAKFDELLGLRPLSPLRDASWTRFAGHLPPGVLPPLFASTWIAVIVRTHCPESVLSTSSLVTRALFGWAVYVLVWMLVAIRIRTGTRKMAALFSAKAKARLSC